MCSQLLDYYWDTQKTELSGGQMEELSSAWGQPWNISYKDDSAVISSGISVNIRENH